MAENHPHHTRPWTDAEYIQAGRYRLVYSTVGTAIDVVHLPGGGEVERHRLPEWARALGLEIRLPIRVRGAPR